MTQTQRPPVTNDPEQAEPEWIDPETGLKTFEGNPVVGTAASVKNMGDGLSKALKMDPAEYPQGALVAFVGVGEVVDIHYPQADDGGLVRVHVIRAKEAMFMAAEGVDPILQEWRVRKAEYEAKEAAEKEAAAEQAKLQKAWDKDHDKGLTHFDGACGMCRKDLKGNGTSPDHRPG